MLAEVIIMLKQSAISVRVEPALKRQAAQTLNGLGLTMSQAVVMFLQETQKRRQLPFDAYIPNEQTKQAITESLDAEKVRHYKNTAALYEDLGI